MNETTLLAALQSMVVYTLIMLFPSNEQTSLPLLSDDMFLQIRQVIYHCATSGLILEQESNNARPPWEAWVHITTKRRAVLSLYIIHWSYSVYHCLPSFDCKDLGFIPAPSPGYLWQASDVKMWESLYNRWLAQWDGNIFLQWEFFGIGPGVRMGARAEEWLEDADEFGMLFISMGGISYCVIIDRLLTRCSECVGKGSGVRNHTLVDLEAGYHQWMIEVLPPLVFP